MADHPSDDDELVLHADAEAGAESLHEIELADSHRDGQQRWRLAQPEPLRVPPPQQASWGERCRQSRRGLGACALAAAVFVALVVSLSVRRHGGRDQSPSPPPPLLRLPDDVVPELYRLSLRPTLGPVAFEFAGNVSIAISARAATQRIVLHARELDILSAELQEADGEGEPRGRELQVREFALDAESETLSVALGEPLRVGAGYWLRLRFRGELGDDLAGFYRSRYTDAGGGQRFIATTQFEAEDARKAFPCFDEPALKANFSIELQVPPGAVALSNMPVASRTPLSDTLHSVRFATSVRMSTYLVAFIVCDFENVTTATARGLPVSLWAPQGRAEASRFALDVAARVVDAYESFFGVLFPLPKIDLVAIPDFAAGAMENWGLITFRQVDLLYDNATDSSAARQRVALVVAHELAHQWFGNLVTMKWWSDLWLNEGFATYVEHIGVNAVFPEWRVWEQFFPSVQQGALASDSLANSHPIHAAVADSASVSEIFDAISYSKGASLILMTQQLVDSAAGEGTFRAALRAYLEAFRYGNAENADLFAAMDAEVARRGAAPLSLVARMQRWTNQQGFPLVTLAADGRGGLEARQQPFVFGRPSDANAQPAPAAEAARLAALWDVPLATKSASGTANLQWLDPRAEAQAVAGSGGAAWLRANTGQWAYVRVNYPEDSWRRLADAISSGESGLSVVDRMGLLEDAFALAHCVDAPLLHYRVPLSIAAALRNETDFIVWTSLLGHLSHLRFLLQASPSYAHLRRFALGLMDAPLSQPNAQIDADLSGGGEEMHVPRLFRVALLSAAAAFGHDATLARSKSLFAGFLVAPDNFFATVHPDLWPLVLGVGVESGAEREWNAVWARYASASPAQQVMILRALGATRVPWLLAQLLQWSIDSTKVRRQDAYIAIVSVAANPLGRELAWDFVRAQWPTLKAGGFGLSRIVRGVATQFSTPQRLSELSAFFGANSTPSVARTVRQALEAVEVAARWRSTRQPQVEEWLSARQ